MIKMRSMVRIHYGDDIHAKEEIHTKDEIFKSTAETLESFLVTSSTPLGTQTLLTINQLVRASSRVWWMLFS